MIKFFVKTFDSIGFFNLPDTKNVVHCCFNLKSISFVVFGFTTGIKLFVLKGVDPQSYIFWFYIQKRTKKKNKHGSQSQNVTFDNLALKVIQHKCTNFAHLQVGKLSDFGVWCCGFI